MDNQTKEMLLRQFSDYLEEVPPLPEKGPQLDLTAFYKELIALKNEVKIESRQVRKGMDEALAIFSGQAEQRRAEQGEAQNAILRPLLLNLLEIRDRLAAANQAGSEVKPSFFERLCRRREQVISAMRQGQEMTLERLDTLLASYQVQPIAAIDQPFDPAVMRAVSQSHDPEKADGLVSGEIRRGFLWCGEVLRLADVTVNKM